MYFRPRFIGPVSPLGGYIASETIPPIHGDPNQGTQGGTPPVLNPDGSIATVGQYYHISAAMYAFLIDLAKNRKWAEPVMSTTGVIMTGLNGDILMGFNLFPVVPVPDVLTITPPPDPLIDGLWTSVILRATFDNIVEDLSLRNNVIGYGGAGNLTIPATNPPVASAAQSKFGGQSLVFPSSTDYVIIGAAGLSAPDTTGWDIGGTYGDPGYTGNFEVSFWVRTPSFGVQQTMFWLGSAQTFGYPGVSMYINAYGQLGAEIATFGNMGTGFSAADVLGNNSRGVLSTNTWHHCALERANGFARLFLDGNPCTTSVADTVANAFPLLTPYNVILGQKMGGVYTLGEGMAVGAAMDDIRVTRNGYRHTAAFIPPAIAYPIG